MTGHRYAVIEDGVVVNVVVCEDDSYAAENGWIALDGLDPQPGIGWTYDTSDRSP